ncbi:MAG: hypothetical protein AAF500_19125 [Myxococcota bacterium]
MGTLTQARRSARSVAFALCISLSFSACGGSSEGGAGGSQSDPGGQAFVASQRVFTPDGRFVLVHLLADLEPQALQVDQGFEFSSFARVRAFNGKVFVFGSEAGQVVRFSVTSDLRLDEDERFSLTNEGVASFDDTTVFISETEAFYFDSFGGDVLEFNPETMQFVQRIDGPDIQLDGFPAGLRASPPVRVGDELYVSLAWQNVDALTLVPAVTVAVFSISERRLLRVVEDSRCAYGHRGFAHEGAFYLVGDQSEGAGNILDDSLPPACLLRIEEGESEFDQDFYVDLTRTSGRPLLAGGPTGIGDGRFVGMVYDSPRELSSFMADDPADIAEAADLIVDFAFSALWRWTVFTLPSGEATVLGDLPLSGTNPFDAFLVDGTAYVPVLAADASASQVYRVDDGDAGTTTLVLESEFGEVLTLEKVF